MTWSNYDDVIAAMRAEGFEVAQLDIGKKTRVKRPGHSQKGWYVLHDITLDDGTATLIGAWGYWQGAEAVQHKVKPGKGVQITPEQRQAIEARYKAEMKREAAERARKAERAAHMAGKAWRQYVPDGESDYLKRKGVESYGLRYAPSGNGTVAVPMMDAAGKVHGLQIIRGKNRGTKLEKENWPKDLALKGNYHLIGGTPRGVVLICEGYATAASVHAATGIPAVVAFFAGNLTPVAQVISKTYKQARILICADDDYRTTGNPGQAAAQTASATVGGAYVLPVFSETRPEDTKGPTDFNDLHALEGLPVVRVQIEAKLTTLGWLEAPARAGRALPKGGGERTQAMPSIISVDEAVERYWGTYGLGGKVLFDQIERRLVHRDDVMNILPPRSWDMVKSHPAWRVARDTEVGFDPTEQDRDIRCNLFGGWPTEPKAGRCDHLLDLLRYLCSNEANATEVFDWMICWLAYPIQHRGAKMHSAIVIHGPQGTGKSRFFEAYGQIFGPYFQVIGQDALEDKFNSDWAEKKLFVIGDEILARQDMYHTKNRLKGFITSPKIRVNPKGVAAHTEKNQMNIVFLSNERQPLVLENDDRRHAVIWVPPKLDDEFFALVNDEIDHGGVEALHDYLLNLDLGDFKPWTRPPMTGAKRELIDLGRSSEERFLQEWQRLELETNDGSIVPFCPCLGSHLFKLYEHWCDRHGERKRGMKDLISLAGKQAGWTAGVSVKLYEDLSPEGMGKFKNRKMIVPSDKAMDQALVLADDGMRKIVERGQRTKVEWLTACFFHFEQYAQGLA